MEKHVIYKFGKCRNKHKTAKKIHKMSIFPLIDTMNNDKFELFNNEDREFELDN